MFNDVWPGYNEHEYVPTLKSRGCKIRYVSKDGDVNSRTCKIVVFLKNTMVNYWCPGREVEEGTA